MMKFALFSLMAVGAMAQGDLKNDPGVSVGYRAVIGTPLTPLVNTSTVYLLDVLDIQPRKDGGEMYRTSLRLNQYKPEGNKITPDMQNLRETNILAEVCIFTTDTPKEIPGFCVIKATPSKANFSQSFTLNSPDPFLDAFICLYDGDAQACVEYSEAFNLNVPKQLSKPVTVSPPTTPLAIFPVATASAQVSGNSITAASPTRSIVTATQSSTQVTVTSPELAEATAASSSSKGGLSLGAKVGIALGAAAVVLIALLLALFLLRRKHRQRSKPEQLMLNQSLNADSHDLITEKEISPASLEGPTPAFGLAPASPTPSQTRHSALAPYDSIPSKPYTGSAASIPKRKPTLASSSVPAALSIGRGMEGESARGVEGVGTVQTSSNGGEPIGMAVPATTISREVSSSSSIGNGARGTTASTGASGDRNLPFQEYHDVPVYGDTRNSPPVFQGGLQAPFVNESDSNREPSMSQAEIDERLREEEEERRIDAAIAEAERVKQGGQGR